MRNHELTRRLLALVAVGVLVACSSGGGGASASPEPSGERVSIRVSNDLIPPTDVVVWVVPETGSRWRLGSVRSNGQQSFNYAPTMRSALHYLLAVVEGPGSGTMQQAREYRSDSFDLEDVRTITWSASRQVVRLTR